MFSIEVSGLDDAIDERFEYNMDIASHYSGCGLIDDETGRLVSPLHYHLDRGTLLGIVQRQQEQITEDRKYFNLKIKSLENKIANTEMNYNSVFAITGENPKEE